MSAYAEHGKSVGWWGRTVRLAAKLAVAAIVVQGLLIWQPGIPGELRAAEQSVTKSIRAEHAEICQQYEVKGLCGH